MQSPCGKCSTCPCSKKDNKRQAEQPQQQPQSNCQGQCQSGSAPQSAPAQAVKNPNVECLCVSKRRQVQQSAPLQPIADTYTCTRPRAEPARQVPMEERCTCRIKPTPPQCECAPPVQPQQQQASYRQDPAPPTHAQIVCGQPLPNQQYNERPQLYTQQGPSRCGHCQQSQDQRRQKKCVIQ